MTMTDEDRKERLRAAIARLGVVVNAFREKTDDLVAHKNALVREAQDIMGFVEYAAKCARDVSPEISAQLEPNLDIMRATIKELTGSIQ
jgi:hypothetical protein